MRSTDEQVRRLRRERAQGATIEQAAMKAGMHRNTGSRHLRSEALPSETAAPRTWQTREDAFEDDWPEMAEMLAASPEFEAKVLFEYLQRRRPGKYGANQLRTFQRRVKKWRARSGPEKEIFFPQEHRPGEAAQTDFTWANELMIMIRGVLYEHKLCVTVLPYSIWQWATPCRSESMAAMREGVQNAFFKLGHVPDDHQTDNSTAATHDLATGKRAFNEEYLALMRHLSLRPRTTQVGAKEQNGTVEATNGALKRALHQHLLIRGNTNFESKEAYVLWLHEVLEQRNATRGKRLEEEIRAMRPLGVRRLPAYSIVDVRVGSGSTIRVKKNTYSVPSRLIGESVRVRVFDDRIEVYLAGELQVERARAHGKGASNIAWRDVVGSMLRKPGALRRYRYRDAMFPNETFKRAYEQLDEGLSQWSADMNYLQVLKLARDGSEHDVEQALQALALAGEVPRFERVAAIAQPKRPALPEVKVGEVELETYDGLTPEAAKEATQ